MIIFKKRRVNNKLVTLIVNSKVDGSGLFSVSFDGFDSEVAGKDVALLTVVLFGVVINLLLHRSNEQTGHVEREIHIEHKYIVESRYYLDPKTGDPVPITFTFENPSFIDAED